MKNKETILFVAVALIVGLLVGIIASKGKEKDAPPAQISAPQTSAPVASMQDMKMLEGVVASDPKNRNAWVELGNLYFDGQMPAKAVEAYAKALELNPNDPNVLTDQGIMYRQLGWFDKAIENFVKANNVDPRHVQSLYNLGVVYRFDLQDYVKASEVWKKYLDVSPTGPAADKIRDEIRQMEAQPLIPSGQMQSPSKPK